MYPKWIVKIARAICQDCHGGTSLHDIVAVGVASPSKQEAYSGPLALVIVACPICGERIAITVREPMESVMEAMREFARLTDEAAKKAKPPIRIPPKQSVAPKIVDESPVRLRPSIRRPTDLPNDAAGSRAIP